jgi:MFS transporter, AAHS family, 4-hydroxybenzoate transporter
VLVWRARSIMAANLCEPPIQVEPTTTVARELLLPAASPSGLNLHFLALIGSVFLLGCATCAIGASQNVPMIAVLRFIASLGIGGCLPSASTVAAEFTPTRRRTMAVTATIVCIPLGGMLAGVFANYVLPALGWRALFFIGGSLPLTLGVLLLLTIPESPRFLVRHPERWDELRRLLGRMHRPTTAGTVFTDLGEQKVESRAGFAAVFQQGRVRDTLALSGAFFLCLLAVYSAFSWLPMMLTAEGLDIAVAGAGLTAYNLGGAASAFFLTQVNVSNTNVLIIGLLVHGLCVNAVQATMYAVCAYAYPTNVRATGTATALGFGRLGAILSSFAGAAVITAGGASGYLTMLGLAMVGALAALMLVRRHIQPLDQRNAVPISVETAMGN